MRISKLMVAVLFVAMATCNVSFAQFFFNFVDGTGFDGNQGAGATMTVMDGGDSLTMTTVSVLAPEFDDNQNLTGAIVDATTNISSQQNSLGVNNPTISTVNFDNMFGLGTESSNFNFDESWTFEFDFDVVVDQIDFTSLNVAGEELIVTIEGVAGTFVFTDGADGDTFDDPFGMTITAGTDVTIAGGANMFATGARLNTMTVSAASDGCEFAFGDVNMDGSVNMLDVEPFVGLITDGVFQCEGDVTEDGIVDLLDVAPFVAILTDP